MNKVRATTFVLFGVALALSNDASAQSKKIDGWFDGQQYWRGNNLRTPSGDQPMLLLGASISKQITGPRLPTYGWIQRECVE